MENATDTHKKINSYIAALSATLRTGQAREHSYRSALETLLKESLPGVHPLNEPSHSAFGAPDLVLLKNRWPLCYVETKDVDADLGKVMQTEQVKRYFGYANLILTNYTDFRFFKHGEEFRESVSIATVRGGTLIPDAERYEDFTQTLTSFLETAAEPVTRAEHLAKIMGEKGRRLRDNLSRILNTTASRHAELLELYHAFKQTLIHDLSIIDFADMYAQTLVYGLFVARYHDPSSNGFTRQKARDLIPLSNPLLRRFFDHITGADFDRRLAPIVEELCVVFAHSDVHSLMHEFYQSVDLWGDAHESPDPVIHFYEDFLREYDPKKKVELGVFYTPLPVVRFIVRSVDEILKRDFEVAAGLADTRRVTIVREIQGKKTKQDVHRVQILDPATGTGTFLNETVRLIRSSFEHQEGRWPRYVNDDLLRRVHGFELMMAPYTIAHLKLATILKESGAGDFTERLGIYLTNSLEDAPADDGRLPFAGFGLMQSLSDESRAAARVKNDTPIMVIMGNPPYSGESHNPGYTANDAYKLEPGTTTKLKERNGKWLNDDYVKFLRFAERMIEKTGDGIVGMITAHGWLDNPTFRGMRWHILSTFDTVYVLDLHGNANKKEVAPTGAADRNVFDIKQGVAITLAVKTGKKKKGALAKVHRADALGSRPDKFAMLNAESVGSIKWMTLEPRGPNYELVVRNALLEEEYAKGFSVAELFPQKSIGVVTARDDMAIQWTREDMERVIDDFQSEDVETLREKYDLGKDAQDWKVSLAKEDVLKNYSPDKFVEIDYRPFDTRWTFYTGNSRGFLCRPRNEVMQHLVAGENVGLVYLRQVKSGKTYQHVLVTNRITESTLVSNRTSEISYTAPLYRDTINSSYRLYGGTPISMREPNLDDAIARRIASAIDAVYCPTPEYQRKKGDVPLTPEDIFDYVYARLHAPSYRTKYGSLLKSDFPRVPYPKNRNQFSALVALGQRLRQLHLFEHQSLSILITTFPVAGTNVVGTASYTDGNVFINQEQFFGAVPEVAWNFWVGGYQPAQKWLKDRKGRTLSSADIEHYQKMIVAFVETSRLMNEVDAVLSDD